MGDPATRILAPGGAEVTVGKWRAHHYRKPFAKVGWDDIRALLQESASGWTKHQAPRLAAALAFYSILSLMPLLLVMISIAGLVFGQSAAQTGVVQQIQILIGEERARIVGALLAGAQNKADGLLATALGMLTLMFGASAMLCELRDALNTIWEAPARQQTTFQEMSSLVRKRLWSIALVLALSILLTGFLLLGTWISAAGKLSGPVLPVNEGVLHVLNALLSLVAVTGLFGAVYKIVPEVAIEWRDVILGAAVTSLLFTPGNLLLGLYLGKACFSSTYGAAASTVVLAVWVYYSSQVFFLGAEFTRAFAERYGSSPRSRPRMLIATPGAAAPPSASRGPITLVGGD
jgi:membrane protein